MTAVSRHRKGFIAGSPVRRLDTRLYTQPGELSPQGLRCLDTRDSVLGIGNERFPIRGDPGPKGWWFSWRTPQPFPSSPQPSGVHSTPGVGPARSAEWPSGRRSRPSPAARSLTTPTGTHGPASEPGRSPRRSGGGLAR
jgi:hypothetical protein